MNIHDYRKGFMDGAKADLDHVGELYIMGYSFDKILELICKDMQNQRLIIDHVDKRPIIIKRHGKIVYEE